MFDDLFVAQNTAQFAEMQCENVKRDNLRRKCFSRSDADFRSGVCQNRAVGFACNHRTLHIADCQNFAACLFCFTHRGNRVGGFAGLRNDDEQIRFVQNRISITKLRSVINFDRHTRKFFEHIFCGESGVPTRSASGDFY